MSVSLKFIDKYEIVSSIGRGSMGVVYKAKDPEIGRLVAIKTLKSVFMGDDAAGNEALQRFRQESRSAGRLHHPNIVTIFEAGRTENGSPYIVMEYIEGKSLEALLSEGGALGPLAALHYLAQIAAAIDYAHSQNVIHRDIKPSNIIVDQRNRPYLLDFGVAKLADTSLTPAGTVVGTPSYMSPEQIKGAQLDARTDLFSFAVVAFEVLSGQRPFQGSDFASVVSNIISKEPISFAELSCNLPSDLEAVFRHGLAKDRENRFPSALDFVDALAQVFGVLVDANGLVGGYTAGLTLEDVVQRGDGNRQRLNTPLGAFFPSSLQGALQVGGGNTAQDLLATALVDTNGLREKAADDVYSSLEQAASEELSPRRSLTGVRSEDRSRQRASVGRPAFVSSLLPAAVGLGLAAVALVAFAKRERLGQFYEGVKLRFSSSVASGKKDSVGVQTEPDEKQGSEGPTEGTLSDPDELTVAKDDSPVQESSENSKQAVTEQLNSEQAEATLGEEAVFETPEAPTMKAGLRKPELVLEDLSAESISVLKDEELGWLLTTENSNSQAARLGASEAGRRSAQLLTVELAKAVKSSDLKLRVEAIKSLTKEPHSGRVEAQQAVSEALNDEEYLVRGFAAKALAQMGGANTASLLEARLQVEKNQVVVKVLNDSLAQLKR